MHTNCKAIKTLEEWLVQVRREGAAQLLRRKDEELQALRSVKSLLERQRRRRRDLPYLKKGLILTDYNRDTSYNRGSKVDYTDYPISV